MTLEIELAALAGFFMSLLGLFGGIAKWLYNKAEARQAKQFASLEEALKQSVSQWGALEKSFLQFQAELPLNYVRREDYIRGQTVIEAKLDALYSKLETVTQRQLMKGSD